MFALREDGGQRDRPARPASPEIRVAEDNLVWYQHNFNGTEDYVVVGDGTKPLEPRTNPEP